MFKWFFYSINTWILNLWNPVSKDSNRGNGIRRSTFIKLLIITEFREWKTICDFQSVIDYKSQQNALYGMILTWRSFLLAMLYYLQHNLKQSRAFRFLMCLNGNQKSKPGNGIHLSWHMFWHTFSFLTPEQRFFVPNFYNWSNAVAGNQSQLYKAAMYFKLTVLQSVLNDVHAVDTNNTNVSKKLESAARTLNLFSSCLQDYSLLWCG